MIRSATLAILVTIGIPASAQSWCPPGATWTYTHSNSWTNEGFARYEYVGDTLIAGSTAQIITSHAEGYDYSIEADFSWDQGPYYTAVDGGLVSLWNGSTFDTLFNIDANIGDHWSMSGSASSAEVSVTDTGSTVVQGVPLRYLITSLNGLGADTIMERFGSLSYQLVPWSMFVLDQLNGPLRCYGDLQIDHRSSWWTYGCESWLGVSSRGSEARISIHPNPGTDHITVSLSPGERSITLFDAIGRVVLHQRSSSERVVVGTAHLPSGIYVVRVDDDMRPLRWLKQ